VPAVGDWDRWRRYTIDERRTILRKVRDITKGIRGGGSLTGHHAQDRKL
jgi:hypothetical protein